MGRSTYAADQRYAVVAYMMHVNRKAAYLRIWHAGPELVLPYHFRYPSRRHTQLSPTSLIGTYLLNHGLKLTRSIASTIPPPTTNFGRYLARDRFDSSYHAKPFQGGAFRQRKLDPRGKNGQTAKTRGRQNVMSLSGGNRSRKPRMPTSSHGDQASVA